MRSIRHKECDNCSVVFQSPECIEMMNERKCPGHVTDLERFRAWMKEDLRVRYRKILEITISQQNLNQWLIKEERGVQK